MTKNKKKSTNTTRAALLLNANEIFGSVDTINEHFIKMKLQPVETMEEAIKKICSLWLNIVDFVNGKFKPFKNKYLLKNYIRHTKKYFNNKDDAKADGLAQLLIYMD